MRLVAIGLGAFLLTLATAAPSAQMLPNDADIRRSVEYYRSGQQLLSSERWDRAARDFQAAIKLNPLLTDAHYGLGHAFMGLRRYTSAAMAFEHCLTAARTIHNLRDKARLHADRLVLSSELRRRASLGLPFEPPPPVLLALGSAHFRNGDRIRAEYYWREAARVDEELGEAWNNLAAIYATSGRAAEAQQAVEKAERAGFRVNPRLKQDIAALQQ